jgi:hypothetical protein
LTASGETNKKSEFETTVQFERRRHLSEAASTAGGGKLAFVLPASDGTDTGWVAEFDADHQSLRITIRFKETGGVGEPHFNDLRLKGHAVSGGKHLASNAFGATVEVSSSVGQMYGIAVAPTEWIFPKSVSDKSLEDVLLGPHSNFSVPMATEEAISLKPNLGVLAVCTLTSDKVITQVGGHEATLDAPYESTIIWNYLPVRVEQLWVYDSRSGRVIHKADATTHRGSKIVTTVMPSTSTYSGLVPSGKSFLFEPGNDAHFTEIFEQDLNRIDNAVAGARSRAKKKRDQIEAEAFCRSGLKDLLSSLKNFSSPASRRDLFTGNVVYDDLPPGNYVIFVVARGDNEVGIWTGRTSVAEDATTNVQPPQVFYCEDPSREVNF